VLEGSRPIERGRSHSGLGGLCVQRRRDWEPAWRDNGPRECGHEQRTPDYAAASTDHP